MNRLVFRPDAEADLLAIALYVAESNTEAAMSLVRRLRERCEILAAHPYAGRSRPELGAGIRSLGEYPYVILYRLEGDASEVVAIIHGARDLPKALAGRIENDRDPNF
jgi:toxin ParE1/3/4